MANLSISCMVVDPTDPNNIFAGTGEGYANIDAIRGAGIFRTTDGASWDQVPSTADGRFYYVNRLAIPADGRAILAATTTGLFRSDLPALAQWTLVLEGTFSTVVWHPSDPLRAIAGTVDTGRAFYSDDGGFTWRSAVHDDPWQGRIELTYAGCNAKTVYASVDVGSGGIWRSDDGGESFLKRASLAKDGRAAAYLGQQGWYNNTIWAGDPSNCELVVVGGIDLWRSFDGGASLVDISSWWSAASAHADHHAIVSHPGYDGKSNRTVYFANDGGLFVAADVTKVGNDARPPRVAGWRSLNSGYAVTQFYGGAAGPSGAVIAGAQDNGTLLHAGQQGTDSWVRTYGGDGGQCAAAQDLPGLFFGEYVHLDVFRSTDGGISAETISGSYWNGSAWAWKPIPYRIPDAASEHANFIAPFALDPNNSNRILAGGRSLWRTQDARATNTASKGPKWTSIKAPAASEISAIAIKLGNSDEVWIGHNNGDLFRSRNATAVSPAWSRVDSGLGAMLPDRMCTRILLDPEGNETAYLAFGSYSGGNVWKTTDSGATWIDISMTLPQVPVRALARHPSVAKRLYIGTEVGLFASEDAGTSWSPTNEGPANCSVEDLVWHGTTLIAFTHGRGAFAIDLP